MSIYQQKNLPMMVMMSVMGDSFMLGLELNSLKLVYYSVAPVFAASGARVGSSFFANVSSGT